MAMEWRNGRLMDDEELERLWQMSEMQKAEEPPLIMYDILIGWVLLVLFNCAFWAFIYWLYLRFR